MEPERKFVASAMLKDIRCAGTSKFAGLETAPDYRRAKVFTELFPDIQVSTTDEWMG